MMKSFFATASISFDDKSQPKDTALADEMKSLGLAQKLTSTEGHLVDLPKYTFAGQIQGEDRAEIHRTIHRGLNGILKKLSLHGKFFIEISLDQDWSCCSF
jgi:hypothetical protein